MNFNLNNSKVDTALPHPEYFTEEQRETKIAQRRFKTRLIMRSLGVLVTSFAGVFSILFVVVTWPVVPKQIGYYMQQIAGTADDQVEAAPINFVPINTDPAADTDGDGFTDGEELAAGFDPRNPAPVKLDTDGDGIKDDVERSFYGTDPNSSDSDGDGDLDLAEIINGFSPIRPSNYGEWVEEHTTATIRIPRIKVEAPVVWNLNPDDIEKDLERGVVHYPGTGSPGDNNNTVITGHSSQWSWTGGKWGTAFVLLDKLKPGDKIYIDYTGKTFVYEVNGREITNPFDTKNFAATPEARLTLMTCWPIGSNSMRLYVKAKLVGTQAIGAQ